MGDERRSGVRGRGFLGRGVGGFFAVILVGLAPVVGIDAVGLEDRVAQDPSTLVESIYREVSKTGGRTPNWDTVRSFFDPRAVIVLRATRTETRLMDVDAFIQDFLAFYERIGPEVGFTETVLSTDLTVHGNVAHCFVVYEAVVEGGDRRPQRGLDSWHLMFRDDRWWVVSVVNESEAVAGPIPESVFGR